MPRALSSLRYRFFTALGLVLFMALLALGLIAQFQVIPVLLAKEEQHANAELDRAQRAIDNELGHLSLFTRDWSVWDDSYHFLSGEETDYVESNLTSGLVFEDANLRAMLFLKPDGTPHLIAGLDPQSGDYVACPSASGDCAWAAPITHSVQEHVAGGPQNTLHTWLHAWPERSMVSVWPIMHSDGSGPAAGWLAMVRVMNDQWLARLQQSTDIEMRLETAGSTGPHPQLSQITRTDERYMQASRLIEAAPSGYSISLQTTLPRTQFQANLGTFRFALYWTLGLLVVVVVVVLILLERMILLPLRQLARFTESVQSTEWNDAPSRLVRRSDEIGQLAHAFQRLLDYQRRQTHSLVELSQHDPLTGLANRRLFDERLSHALTKAAQSNQALALIMVDIDHFKAYNDHYGHPAGDRCLIAIASAMRERFEEPPQLVARTGGEEFMIILPAMTTAAGLERAETLRQAIAALRLEHAASPTASVVTVSIGVACYVPPRAIDSEALIAAADTALYSAKQAGRDCVRLDHAMSLA
ncbi:diguanylate cyclase [Halomonas sp. HP20-15]|uniref:diguanylate cyclase domain-containing protein n=1 Tax=Halomonas sp. HP20-15 TaxID=3085901 RepID=UPI0029821C91|nr:diguanylate cyclase [Halomonas sp. HP20-15]MDW5378005.1 diguanylate cyclase [Halomonas sp. HP20-15]